MPKRPKDRRHWLSRAREPVDELHHRMYSKEFGADFMRNFERTGAWFAYEGLARLALELEFEDRYRQFADERDGSGQESAP